MSHDYMDRLFYSSPWDINTILSQQTFFLWGQIGDVFCSICVTFRLSNFITEDTVIHIFVPFPLLCWISQSFSSILYQKAGFVDDSVTNCSSSNLIKLALIVNFNFPMHYSSTFVTMPRLWDSMNPPLSCFYFFKTCTPFLLIISSLSST